MREPELRKVRPLDDPGLDEPRGFPMAGLTAVVLLAGAVAVAAYLAAPRETSSTTTTDAAAPGRLALQTEESLWVIDPATRAITLAEAGTRGGVPWRTTIDGRRVGAVHFLGEGGDVDLDALPGSVFAILLTGQDALGSTPLPVALVPIWPGPEPQGYDLVIARTAGAGDEWTDIAALPGCGLPLPVAAPDARDVLSVWCTTIDDVRLLVEFPTGPGGDAAPAAVETLIVDSTGTMWRAVLGGGGPAVPAGAIRLEPGELLPGIAALSRDGAVLYAGVAGPGEAAAAGPARRLVAYEHGRGTELWSTATPVPFESLAVAADGVVYAYSSGSDGPRPRPDSALLAIDPVTGAARVVMQPLDLGAGRLLAP